jgi:hypothetical protein
MATILLQAAGGALGSVFGPVGGIIGAAIGSLAGYAIDRTLLAETRHYEGPRLSGARPFTAEEGVSIPRVYGMARVGGIMIWATRFEEASSTSGGGKGEPKVTEYSYFANVAFLLCEGDIAGIRRVWADGREVDRETIELRVHKGTETQGVDALIAAKQGNGNAPAYRGSAYVVIERFDLGAYGNRIPQFQFEVIRPVGPFHEKVRAVAMIPGSTEYGLSPAAVTREIREGETKPLNRHVLSAGSDFLASLDELEATCPNLEHIALVVSWFGDDLRAGTCRIRPGVTTTDGGGLSQEWGASVRRGAAMLMSTHEGNAAFGGTPSDRSVMEAISAIRARGLKVTLYPFLMMDVPAANSLPDPYGGAKQAAYPWRGRITCMPAPGQPGTADRTAAARTQVNAFCGAALPGQFEHDDDMIDFDGDPSDWGFRRFVLHHAALAKAAGGVDAFVIGSELRGLTTLRDNADAFPFVEKLCALAGELRTMLGSATKISYAADWSEYFGYQPPDGDVYYHLDPLWAHAAIDAVGIDNYMPLSDWRDGDYRGGNPDGFAGPYDVDALRAAITSGEGFDWYYPDAGARAARERAPITDGAYGKPWVYRYKDLLNWWSQPHRQRIDGVEAGSPTAWVPRSKPIWFTELGCPAVDKGPNQPNVFPDPKSAESALPYFSDGGRSDIAQRRFIEAHADHWDSSSPAFDDAWNPTSAVYGDRMVDASRTYLWAWDARPYPAFPQRDDEWSDHANWHYGHWLNGRLASPSVGDLINAILGDHACAPAVVTGVEATVPGYVIYDPTSARAALEPLADLFGLACLETGGTLTFRGAATKTGPAILVEDKVLDDRQPVLEQVRPPDHQLPGEAVLTFRDPMTDYQSITVRDRRVGLAGHRQETISFPGVLEAGQGRALAGDWMRRIWSEREQIGFAVGPLDPVLVPGAVVRLPETGDREFLITQIEDGLVRRVAARQVARGAPARWESSNARQATAAWPFAGTPLAWFLDLPLMDGSSLPQDWFRLAAWQTPWRGQAVFSSPEESGYALRASVASPATVGTLAEPLAAGPLGRIDLGNQLTVRLNDGELASVSRGHVLNGANAIAVQSASGVWEISQFEQADEIEPDVWRLSRLLRGQFGTDDATAAGAPSGARVVLLNEAVRPAGLRSGEAGLHLNWRVGPRTGDFSAASFALRSETGGLRALTPLAPVHLRARPDGGGLFLSWIRRGRVDADNWLPADIPLGEETESYQVEVASAGGVIVRTETVTLPAFTYSAAMLAADFGTPPAGLDVTVRQMSAAVGPGLPRTLRVTL